MSKKPKTFLETVVKQEPENNVIPKEIMDERISKVFNQVSATLQKSLGPLGAHSIISQPPIYHVTKDGFTIMKNMRYNSQYGYVDQVISNMVSDICGRLNYAVGDGTTSAVISANSMYQHFKDESDEIKSYFFLPRNILSRLKVVTEYIAERLTRSAINIQELPIDEMCEYIRKVVYISSNADEEMTNTIVDVYKQIGYPAINVVKAADGVTKSKVIEGFMFQAKLMDKIYVNNDDNSQSGSEYDVVMFDHKVRLEVYTKFIKQLAFLSKLRGRKLICMAPTYDEVALHGDILNDLNAEFRQTKDISLIIMGYKMSTDAEKKRAADLCMLLNTPMITQGMETELCRAFDSVISNCVCKAPTPEDILSYINLDERCIPYTVINEGDGKYLKSAEGFSGKDISKSIFRVGYCDEAELHIDRDSIFRGFHYDEALYEKYLLDAKYTMDKAIEKYKKLATFNFEVDHCKRRYQSLKLKMAQIEVGSTTDFSQEFLKDAMDDAVKAAESAYRNGVINGCHISLLDAILTVQDRPDLTKADKYLLKVLYNAFKHVRLCVLENGLENNDIDMSKISNLPNTTTEDFIRSMAAVIKEAIGVMPFFTEKAIKNSVGFMKFMYNKYESSIIPVFDFILEFELYTGTVLDLDMTITEEPTVTFGDTVINSAATDREILIATSDLVGLLVTGNQLVITTGNH